VTLLAALLLVSTQTSSTATVTPPLEGLVLDESPLTTSIRPEPGSEVEIGRTLLDIPGAFIELAFMPLQPLVELSERYQVHQRLFDLITNDELTFAASPVIEVFSSSGIGFGGAALYNDPLLSSDRVSAIVIGRVNGDISSTGVIAHRLPSMSGRTIKLEGGYYLNHDFRYYGVDPDNTGVRTLIEDEGVDVVLTLQVLNPGDSDFRLYLSGAYRHRELVPGTPTATSLDLPITPGDGFTAPGGFNQSLDYPEAGLRLEFDSRDSGGRTTTGAVASVEGVFTRDLQGAGTGGLQGTTQLSFFAPVLPLHRVVFMQFGAKFAAPIQGTLPLHNLVRLGGQHTLRGYDTERFLGRFGWWSTFEYRYKVFEETDTGIGFSAALFFDAGQVGEDFGRMMMSPVRWSAGLGLRLEHSLFLLGRLQLGFSPEGIQVSVGLGELL